MQAIRDWEGIIGAPMMNKTMKNLTIALILLSTFTFQSCKKDEFKMPTIDRTNQTMEFGKIDSGSIQYALDSLMHDSIPVNPYW